MADQGESQPGPSPDGHWEWKDDWGPLESAAPNTSTPPPVARARPGVGDPPVRPPTSSETRPKSRPWAAVAVALSGAVLAFVWWQFWWGVDHTSVSSRTQYAWPFLYLATVTCGYVFVIWRWFFRR